MLRSHPPQVKVAKLRAPLPMLHSHPPQVKVAKLRAPLPMLHSHPPMAARFLFVHLHALFIAQMAAGIIYCSALTLYSTLWGEILSHEPGHGPILNIYIYICVTFVCVCAPAHACPGLQKATTQGYALVGPCLHFLGSGLVGTRGGPKIRWGHNFEVQSRSNFLSACLYVLCFSTG